MTYELGDDEVAFIISPTSKTSLEEWDGTVSTGIAVGDNFRHSDRRFLLMQEINKRAEEDKPLQKSNGKVINFNEYTKTKGNA